MKIGFYNPYLKPSGLGGGERYTLELASYWSKIHNVSVFWDGENFLTEASNRFRLDLSDLKIVPNIFEDSNLWKRYRITHNYDLIFVLSDGSVPMSFAKRNILHFQIPFQKISFPLWKLALYQVIICNSKFTKTNIKSFSGKEIKVIYPPVDIKQFSSQLKKKIILSVGRFSSVNNMKKQNVLIESFIKFKKNHIADEWSMVLTGGLLDTDETYFHNLKKQVGQYPISLVPNCNFEVLKKFYGEAMIYWHAAGFKEIKPENMEHFGISTVESMASGAIPIVYDGGGQTEIIKNGRNGFLWKTPDELMDNTFRIIKDIKLRELISKKATEDAKLYDVQVFHREYDNLLKSLWK
jgi:glycosyltransferase involved in cell wall biosynthesis